jgi:hypothetical protein
MQASIDTHVAAQRFGPMPPASEKNGCAEISEAQLLEPKEKTRRVRGMTYKKLYQHILLGYGQGSGPHYQPWLQIRKKNPSPKSNQVVATLAPLDRVGHFFSRGEYHTALLLLWLGVKDLREQYPIWPTAHPHPLDGNEYSSTRPWSKGLLAIADEVGIDHGSEIGSSQPYVATIDILATVEANGQEKLLMLSSKPITCPDDEVKWRTLERLELERRYAEEIGAIYRVLTSALIPTFMAGYLEWWMDAACLRDPALVAQASDFSDIVMVHSSESVSDAITAAASDLRLDIDSAWLLFQHCCWTQAIDIDPTKPLLVSYPIRKGGKALRTALRKEIFLN